MEHTKQNERLTAVFVVRFNGDEYWKAIVDGIIVPADFNSKGAAEAAIPVERARRAKKLAKEAECK